MGGDVDIHSSSYVRELFDRVSSTYGYTNYVASFGFTERWRRQCIDACCASGRVGCKPAGRAAAEGGA